MGVRNQELFLNLPLKCRGQECRALRKSSTAFSDILAWSWINKKVELPGLKPVLILDAGNIGGGLTHYATALAPGGGCMS